MKSICIHIKDMEKLLSIDEANIKKSMKKDTHFKIFYQLVIMVTERSSINDLSSFHQQ